MKQKLTYLFSLLLTAFFLLPWSGAKAADETVDVAVGTTTNAYVPFYGSYADTEGTKSQFIYLSSELEDIAGGTIKAIKFYTNKTAVTTYGSAVFSIKMAEVDATSFSAFLSPTFTEVYSGALSTNASGEMLATFNISNFVYAGNQNLLIEVSVTTAGSWVSTYFYGQNISARSRSYYMGYSAQESNQSFVPKATFTYTPAPTTCPKPTLTLDDKDDESASFSWTAGGTETQWQYLNLPAATTLTPEHWNSATLTDETSVKIDNLDGNTNYIFYLRAYCSASDQSKVAKNTYQTDCGTIKTAALPKTFDFTGTNNTVPECWTVLRTSDQAYNAYIYSNQLRFEGNNSSYYTSRKVVVILPKTQTDIKNLKISFDYVNKGTTTSYPRFQVGCISSLTDISKFKALHTLTRVNTTTSTGDLSLAGADEGSYIAILCNNPDGSTSSGNYSYIDNLIVKSSVDCSKPSVTSVAQSGTGKALATWTAKDGVTSYQYCYVESGEDADWSGNLTIGTNSVEFSVTEAGDYDFYVKCVCGGDPSDAAPFTISACQAITNIAHTSDLFNGTTVTWANGGDGPWDVYYTTDEGEEKNWTKANTDEITSREYALAGLTPGNDYTIEVRNDCGSTASTTYSPVYTAPANVEVVAANIKDATAQATWDAVADVTNGYKYICQTAGSNAPSASDWASAEAIENAYVNLSGLTVNTSYDFYVCSNYGGNLSTVVGPINFTTVPVQPANVSNPPATTDKTATFTWEQGGAETQYQYLCVTKNTAPYWTGVEPIEAGERTITVKGLAALTNYDFYIRSYYGAGEGMQSAAVKVSFQTDCGVNALGWEEQFSSSLPQCWTNESEYGATWQVYSYADESYSGYYSLYYNFKRFNSSSSYDAVLTTPPVAITNEAVLSFYWKSAANANVEVSIKASGEVAEVLGSLTPTSASSNYAEQQYNIDSKYVGKTVNFIFRGKGNGNSGSNRYFRLDDVSVILKPCDAPEFAAANVLATTDGAIVSCDADKWNLKYKLTSAEDIPANWTLVENITDESYTITGCTPGTEYDVQVQAVCSATRSSAWTTSQTFTPQCLAPFDFNTTALSYNSASITWTGDAQALRYKAGTASWSNVTPSTATSHNFTELEAETTYTVQVKASCEEGDNWSDEFEFTTKCAPKTITKVAPYNADFSGLTNEMPACWEKSETTYPYVTSGELKFYANEANQTAILPAFTNDIATLVLKFNYKNYSSLSGYGKLQVGYINTSDEFVPFSSTLANKSTYAATEINFFGVENAKNIAIRFTDNANSEAFSYIKDVVVELAPTCYAPAAINEPTDITGTSATITWDPSTRNNETHYLYTCVLDGEEPNWDAATKVAKAVAPAENTANLSGLTPTSDYVFYVRSLIEANNDTSDVISKAFQTECGIEAVPYEEDFTSTTLPRCWANSIDGDNSSWSVYSAEVGYGGSGCSMRFNGNQSNSYSAHLSTPSIAIGNDSTALHFFYQNTKGATFKVFVKEEDEDSVQIADLSQQTSDWTSKAILLSSYNNKTIKFYFFAQGNAASASALRLDNVSINKALIDKVDNTATLAALNGQTLDVVIGRTIFCDGDYNTICLPFDLPSLEGTPLAGATVKKFKYAVIESDELQVRVIDSEEGIKAGVPYLIKFAAGDNIVSPLFKNVTINKNAQTIGQDQAVEFVGTFAPQAFAAGDQNTLFVYTNNNLTWSAEDSNLKGFRAYFNRTATAGAPLRHGMRARIVEHQQMPTGCENINADGKAVKLLENNQVVIIRNGVKYTIQGQKIQ